MIRDPRTFSGQSNGRKALTIPASFIVLFVVLAAAIAIRAQVARPNAVPAAAAAGESEPAKVEPLGTGNLNRVTLTSEAVARLGIQTVSVREAQGAGHETVVPYGAVYYDVHGQTWVYTNLQPLVFVRHRVAIDRVDGDRALLSEGPPPGSKVAAVGVAELVGTEFGGLVEQ
ncbi:MAG: hypothetical protein E6H00_10590 [Bacillati bacterium ANGP1]|uniref:Uncharacterized protein n=1 Tax=Candidatus Segetimicrobium genomatis TaxID=2569760 RepID=A0A537K0W5_9BACT|nr:MAG: hypothetical protein E6H00_10590 [Terrabacteria group bacterium ANGP1]